MEETYKKKRRKKGGRKEEIKKEGRKQVKFFDIFCKVKSLHFLK